MCLQFGQRYVEEQDDKTVTEWMLKQVLASLSSHQRNPQHNFYTGNAMLLLSECWGII